MKSILPLIIGWAALIAGFVVWKLGTKKKSAPPSTDVPQALYFKSNKDALAYACEFLENTHSIGSVVPALVDQVWDNKDDGMFELGIFLASSGASVPATSFVPKTLKLQVGDLIGCSVIPRENRPFVMVECKLKPEYSLKSRGWTIEVAFRRNAQPIIQAGLANTPLNSNISREEHMRYRVSVDDNFHYMDESERTGAGTYETAAEAIEVAKNIVDASLRHLYKPGMTPERLYDDYQDFGDDPYIVPRESEHSFSAWNYAKERCASICAELSNE